MKKLLTKVKHALIWRIKLVGSAVIYIVCLILPKIDKNEYWVICERGTDARDNGYAFYQYMVEKHPRMQVYYLITTDSPDYSKVAPHAVRYGSLRNYYVVAKADKIISTHCYTALPSKSEILWNMLGLAKKFYFLQHGITTAYIPYLFGDRTKMQLFCCGAVPEYKYIQEHFRHPNNVVQLTGLARYDNLVDCETKQQILVMPTWRRYLNSEEEFLKSDYYNVWNMLLNDSRLLSYLEQTDTKLIFYPHYELQPYLKHFRIRHSCVKLADFEHYDVQQLLKESRLLITDYSSVFFDFAYMRKPSIYFQFDSEEYHKQHYAQGYFCFERDGFGEVEYEHEKLVDRILSIVENNYQMETRYQLRAKKFFAYHDDKNCERIYQAILTSSKLSDQG